MYRVWARGERSEIELRMEAGSPMKGLGSQQDKCSNPWDYEHLKGSLGKTTPVLMWSVGLRDTTMWSVGLRDTTEAECLVRSPEQLRQEVIRMETREVAGGRVRSNRHLEIFNVPAAFC